jgi:hypothetical protein
VDIGGGPEYLDKLKSLRETRLDEIQNRSGEAEDLDEGPTVVLHVIPNSVFSHETVRPADLLSPSVLGDTIISGGETRGKMQYTHEHRGDGYAFIRNDGLVETATTSMFYEGHEEGELWISGIVQSGGMGLDGAVILTLRQALKALSDAGVSGVASVSLSLLNAENVKLHYDTGIRSPFQSHAVLGASRYSTEFVTVDIGETEIIQVIEPMLSEVWRQFGIEEGTKNIDEGEWQQGRINVNAGNLSKGDR